MGLLSIRLDPGDRSRRLQLVLERSSDLAHDERGEGELDAEDLLGR